jgi:hypothetical protein
MADTPGKSGRTGIGAVLTKPLPIPAWVWLVFALPVIVWMVFDAREKQAASTAKWEADDRTRIQSLEETKQLIDMDVDVGEIGQLLSRSSDADSPLRAAALNLKANVLAWDGKTDEAMPLYQQARALLVKHLGEEHPDVKTVDANLQLCRQLPRPSAAQ